MRTSRRASTENATKRWPSLNRALPPLLSSSDARRRFSMARLRTMNLRKTSLRLFQRANLRSARACSECLPCRATRLSLNGDRDLLDRTVAGLSERAGHWLGDAFFVNRSAAECVFSRRTTRHHHCPVDFGETQRPLTRAPGIDEIVNSKWQPAVWKFAAPVGGRSQNFGIDPRCRIKISIVLRKRLTVIVQPHLHLRHAGDADLHVTRNGKWFVGPRLLWNVQSRRE